MKRRRRDSQQTRERLLEAAGAIFASKGYRAATVAEISRKAKANIAAVNYHFGTKKHLYAEAWRYEFRKSISAHPPHGGGKPDAPAEERLHGRIRSILHRIMDPDSREFDIFHKELASPTGLLTQVKRKSIEPIHKGFTSIVRELLGQAATDEQVALCTRSIMSQCLGPMMRERRRKMTPPGEPTADFSPPLGVDIETLSDHITSFSLAGIAELRGRKQSIRKKRK